jgi:hypothetical protein
MLDADLVVVEVGTGMPRWMLLSVTCLLERASRAGAARATRSPSSRHRPEPPPLPSAQA